jgi:RNase adaptor protein for sRNA GlmZ degradation
MKTNIHRDYGSPHRVQVESFGYLHGDAPYDAHLTLDVRKLLYNPYKDDRLRELTGEDEAVRDKVLACSGAAGLITNIARLTISIMIQHYPLNITTRIAIGCSGGRHRSVVIANVVGQQLSAKSAECSIIHRDILRPVIHRGANHG